MTRRDEGAELCDRRGTAGFVLATGSMSSSQSGEGEIRKNLVEAGLVDCIGVNRHVLNVFQEQELEREATCAKLAQVRQEGERRVQRGIEHYNLDVVISVGYRVKSLRGTQFRQ